MIYIYSELDHLRITYTYLNYADNTLFQLRIWVPLEIYFLM